MDALLRGMIVISYVVAPLAVISAVVVAVGLWRNHGRGEDDPS